MKYFKKPWLSEVNTKILCEKYPFHVGMFIFHVDFTSQSEVLKYSQFKFINISVCLCRQVVITYHKSTTIIGIHCGGVAMSAKCYAVTNAVDAVNIIVRKYVKHMIGIHIDTFAL